LRESNGNSALFLFFLLELLGDSGAILTAEIALPIALVLAEILLEGNFRIQFFESVVQQINVLVAAFWA
jgi:hypothetical protein